MSKRKPARTVRLGCERLENRCLMAGDVSLSIQVLDNNRQPVTELDVGEQFVLQVYSQGAWTTTADLTFDSALARLSDDAHFSPLFRNSEGRGVSRFFENGEGRDGHWNLSASAQGADATHDNLKEKHLVLEVSGQALAGGEIVFQLNASSHVVALNGEVVTGDFGYSRIQVGDKLMFPPSPWRNPGNPADVDGNGQVDLEDAIEVFDAIAYELEPDGSLEGFPTLAAPFLDVNGDRLANYTDVMMVLDHLPDQFMPTADRFARHLMDSDFKITFEAINVRTGNPVAAEILEGDILKIRIKASTDSIASIPFGSNILLPDLSQYSMFAESIESANQAPWPKDPTFFVLMNQIGEKKLTFKVNTTDVVRAATLQGQDPTEIPNLLARLNQLLASATIPVTVKPNPNIPNAENKTYTYHQFDNVSVDQAAELLRNGNTKLIVDSTEGLLAGADEGSHVYFLSALAADLITLNDDGSFVFKPWPLQTLYHAVALDYEFPFVIVNSNGTSRVATLKIDGVVVPLVEIRVFAVDQAGNEVTQLVPGQRFTLKATTISNHSAYKLPVTSVHNHNVRDFAFTYQFDSTVATAQSAPIPSTEYFTEFLRLGEENGKLILVTEKIPASMKLKDGKYNADFRGYTMASTLAPVTLFEQEMIANAVGQLNVKLDELTSTTGFDVKAIQVKLPKIEVVGSPSLTQNFLNPKDVNDDKKITASDALLVINGLNSLTGSLDRASTLAKTVTPGHHLDVNADGRLTASDALFIINELNLPIGNRATQLELVDSSTSRFGIEMNPTRSNESLVVRILGANPDSSYQVKLDGHSVGQVETDQRGRGRLVVNKDTLTQVMLTKQVGKQSVRLEVGSLISTDLSIDLN